MMQPQVHRTEPQAAKPGESAQQRQCEAAAQRDADAARRKAEGLPQIPKFCTACAVRCSAVMKFLAQIAGDSIAVMCRQQSAQQMLHPCRRMDSIASILLIHAITSSGQRFPFQAFSIVKRASVSAEAPAAVSR